MRTRERRPRDQPIQAEPPPIARGTDAVAAWAQELGLTIVALPAQERSRHARACLNALGQARAAAADAEALLLACRQRGELVDDAGGSEPPTDEVALTLWQWYEIARLCWVAACAPIAELCGEARAQCGQLAANIRARPTAQADDMRRRHRLPRDAREAVREHEEVSAKLQEEALHDSDVAAARRGLAAFGQWMRRDYLAPPHIQVICAALEEVEAGECRRLIVEVPPRHGKTVTVSELFPAWYLGRHPDRDVMSASHSQEFADGVGRAVRNGINSDEFGRVFPGVHLAQDSAAAARFNIDTDDAWVGDAGARGGSRLRRGVYKGFGRTGRYTGSGANLLILDDLIAEHEADSDAAKHEAHRAIRALRSRLAPKKEGAAWVVVNTRYREDDPIGYILSEYADDGGKGKPWRRIRFPALAEEAEDHRLPDGTLWHRDIGDPLWIERFTRDDLEALRVSLLRVSPQDWYGQYLCRPVPAAGAMVDVSQFRRYGSPAPGEASVVDVSGQRTLSHDEVRSRASRIVVSVDTSKGASGSAARTAIGVWCELHGCGRMDGAYLWEATADPIGFAEQVRRAKEVCNRLRPHALLIEDKSTGEVLIPILQEADDWVRTPIYAINPGIGGDKVARMATATPQIRDGQVWIPARGADWAPWLADFEKEMTFFPLGKLKDLVDMTSQFLNWRREHPIAATGTQAIGGASGQLRAALGGGAWHGSGLGGGRVTGIFGGGRGRGW